MNSHLLEIIHKAVSGNTVLLVFTNAGFMQDIENRIQEIMNMDELQILDQFAFHPQQHYIDYLHSEGSIRLMEGTENYLSRKMNGIRADLVVKFWDGSYAFPSDSEIEAKTRTKKIEWFREDG